MGLQLCILYLKKQNIQQFILEKKLEYWIELVKNSKLMNYNVRTIAQIILTLEDSFVTHWEVWSSKNNKMHTNHMYVCYMNSDAYLIFFLLFWQFQMRIFYCEILDSVLKLEPWFCFEYRIFCTGWSFQCFCPLPINCFASGHWPFKLNKYRQKYGNSFPWK